MHHQIGICKHTRVVMVDYTAGNYSSCKQYEERFLQERICAHMHDLASWFAAVKIPTYPGICEAVGHKPGEAGGPCHAACS